MRVGPAANVARINVAETITALWTFANANGISLDDIIERTVAAGVTIDGVRLRDIAIDLLGKASPANRILGSDVVGDADERFRLHAGGTMQWGDGTGTRDTTLFRDAANVLATDDSFQVAGVLGLIADIITERTADTGVSIDGVLLKDIVVACRGLAGGGSTAYVSNVIGDSVDRFLILADGSMEWGPGDAARDIGLTRRTIGQLAATLDFVVDRDFTAAGNMDALGNFGLNSRDILLGTGDNNNVDIGSVTVQRCTPTGASSITGLAGGVVRRVLVVTNVATSGTVSLSHQDANSTAANRIIGPNAASVNLDQGESAILWYDNARSRWCIISRSN